jgi:hypothetical protein
VNVQRKCETKEKYENIKSMDFNAFVSEEKMAAGGNLSTCL